MNKLSHILDLGLVPKELQSFISILNGALYYDKFAVTGSSSHSSVYLNLVIGSAHLSLGIFPKSGGGSYISFSSLNEGQVQITLSGKNGYAPMHSAFAEKLAEVAADYFFDTLKEKLAH